MADSRESPIPSGDSEGAFHIGLPANAEPQVERRQRRRALISAPVRVRSAYCGANGPDEISTTLDVSRNGFLFLSARPTFGQGMVVAVTFPYSKSALAVQAEQPGRVVRVSALADGRSAVAIALGAGGRRSTLASEKRTIANDSRSSVHKSQTPAERPLIVILDADVEVREALKNVLSAEGYEVIALPGARQAHALLNQVLPALLIAEIEGEDLPGLDLCARIKSTPRLKTVPVVLTTRSAYPSDFANAHSLGAVVCIAKPFRPERVGHVVRLLVPSGDTQRR
jgi:CheY-like chemotaxis protein